MSAIFRIGAVALALLHISGVFLPQAPVFPMFLASLAMLVPGLFLMSKSFRNAACIFLAMGVGILAWTGQPFEVWMSSFTGMTNTVAIMVALQLFSVPVAAGRYDRAIESWAARHIKSRRALFVFSTIVPHLFASFLMLGAIPVSMSLLGPAIEARVDNHERFLSAAMSRGYVLAVIWAPGAINLYLVVQATGVAWSSILLPGFLLALCGLGASVLMESGKDGVIRESRGLSGEPGAGMEAGMPALTPTLTAKAENRAVRRIFYVALGIVGGVLALEALEIGVGYTRILIAGTALSLAWVAVTARDPEVRARSGVREAFADYWRNGILKVSDIGPFFVAMGVFSGAIQASGYLDAIAPALRASAQFLGVWSVFLLPLVIIGLSLLGFHPIMTIVLIGTVLAKAGMPVPPLAIALALATGGAASYMISPFAGIIMSLAKYTRSSAWKIAVRWNGAFSLAFYAMGIAFSLAWGFLFGR
jgi:hypothetical protein